MRSKIFTVVGIVCLLLAGILGVYNYCDDKRVADSQDKIIEKLENIEEVYVNPVIEMPEVDVDGVACIGILEIDGIELRLPVLSECTLDSLKKAPGRFYGSVYLNNMVIGGHNSRAQFSKLNKLKEGDLVRFIDVTGNVFEYHVKASEVIGPETVDELNNGWPLSLFMCTYDNLNRYVVRCE